MHEQQLANRWSTAGLQYLAESMAGASSCGQEVAEGVGSLGQDVIIGMRPRRARVEHGEIARVPQRVWVCHPIASLQDKGLDEHH